MKIQVFLSNNFFLRIYTSEQKYYFIKIYIFIFSPKSRAKCNINKTVRKESEMKRIRKLSISLSQFIVSDMQRFEYYKYISIFYRSVKVYSFELSLCRTEVHPYREIEVRYADMQLWETGVQWYIFRLVSRYVNQHMFFIWPRLVFRIPTYSSVLHYTHYKLKCIWNLTLTPV